MDHAPDTHAPHSHGHAHDHSHDHGGGDYYLQQLLTVFICGAFGVAGVLMYTLGKLNFILAPAFHIWVLIGSGLLLAAVVIRGVAIWQSAGQHTHDHHHHGHDHAHHHYEPGEECDHDHKPGEACDHHHGHSHDHADHSAADHDHGNIYWRVVVLAFPVVILAMGLPNSSFSKEREEKILGKAETIGDISAVAEKTGAGVTTDFDSLASIAYDPAKREAYTGTKASIVGKIRPVSSRELQLYKMKMTCCSADMIPLQARIYINSRSDSEARAVAMKAADDGEYEVNGQVQFAQDKKGDYITVLVIDPKDPNNIKKVK